MILGAATCGLEIIEAMPEMDIIIVPVGGGGLLAGISLCLKLVKPTVQVYGVEPYGADSIFQSLSCHNFWSHHSCLAPRCCSYPHVQGQLNEVKRRVRTF